ncbi:MAG TPA: capsular biosynthesis protein [Polyangiaceae bacterium]|nr:capsular biosynthesis protein [Polyangiaceae bacterium]
MASVEGRRLLLLQGPAGPFFARVAAQLRAAGASVLKVNFNGGEDLYYRGAEVVRFRGALEAWPAFFEELLNQHRIDGIVLFGDCRPLHRIAIARARKLGVEVFVFEEGYLRPDFVTLERDGVNGHSSIPRDPSYYSTEPPETEAPHRPVKHAFIKSALHTICYASATALGKSRYPLYRHHRDIRPIAQARLWSRGALRRIVHTVRDREVGARLLAQQMPPYFFVPLQVHLDSQLAHSRYATINEFIREVVGAFAEHAPKDCSLLLKLHPMDRPYSDYSTDVEALRLEHGLGDRLLYVDVINLPAALRGARGTIVINSTVGLSSLTHGTPVKCLGRAVYDMPRLTHQGSLAEFFTNPAPVDRQLYRRFRHWLRDNNQLNGSVWSRLHEDPARLLSKR